MTRSISNLHKALENQFSEKLISVVNALNELTIEISVDDLLDVLKVLRDDDAFLFEQLVDIAGVDYLTYGLDEWSTNKASTVGFERGRKDKQASRWEKPRYAVVYHLLSVTLNQRVRVKVFVEQESMLVPSVVKLWSGANWFEREAFDLFGLLFNGHPDLRRLLTDYGFIGHPFRKDFPVIGELEMRYDEEQQQCIYEPVSIEERILVPRVIR
ncbi:MAG: NADH-quinone oxidoreductase subunit C [Kangiellaceae bacterium]|nr:NADH-quinone oxidoreductase subunit C [Kangiellaceae bacterium]